MRAVVREGGGSEEIVEDVTGERKKRERLGRCPDIVGETQKGCVTRVMLGACEFTVVNNNRFFQGQKMRSGRMGE